MKNELHLERIVRGEHNRGKLYSCSEEIKIDNEGRVIQLGVDNYGIPLILKVNDDVDLKSLKKAEYKFTTGYKKFGNLSAIGLTKKEVIDRIIFDPFNDIEDLPKDLEEFKKAFYKTFGDKHHELAFKAGKMLWDGSSILNTI